MPMMLLSLAALAALIPAAVVSFRRELGRPDGLFWLLLAAALAGAVAYAAVEMGGGWRTSFSVTLWTSIAASLAIFALLAAGTQEACRLAPLLLPYLAVLGLLATLWSHAARGAALHQNADAWLVLHIIVSVLTYALATIAAVAGTAVLLRERALKRKQPGGFVRLLPSVAEGGRLQVRLLTASEFILGLGVVTGMAVQYLATGRVLALDHKTLLSILAFAVIGLLLFLHYRTGLRGQRAARLLLLGYLLLTLAYPGVKFVTDVLIS